VKTDVIMNLDSGELHGKLFLRLTFKDLVDLRRRVVGEHCSLECNNRGGMIIGGFLRASAEVLGISESMSY
jgi:hypothetical protein